jgi:hypothetical protein
MSAQLVPLRLPREDILVLGVSSCPADLRGLSVLFSRVNWILYGALSVRAAALWLARKPVPVVICMRQLHDGTWRRLLRELRRLPQPPRVLVCSDAVDENLWEEVKQAGGYHVLISPFEARDVYFCVHMAWESWRRQWGKSRLRADARY